MISADLFVGVVAIGVGVFAMLSGFFNWEWSYQLHKTQWIETRLGRVGARAVYVVIGIGMIILGCAIAMGFGINRSPQQEERSTDGDIGLVVDLTT